MVENTILIILLIIAIFFLSFPLFFMCSVLSAEKTGFVFSENLYDAVDDTIDYIEDYFKKFEVELLADIKMIWSDFTTGFIDELDGTIKEIVKTWESFHDDIEYAWAIIDDDIIKPLDQINVSWEKIFAWYEGLKGNIYTLENNVSSGLRTLEYDLNYALNELLDGFKDTALLSFDIMLSAWYAILAAWKSFNINFTAWWDDIKNVLSWIDDGINDIINLF